MCVNPCTFNLRKKKSNVTPFYTESLLNIVSFCYHSNMDIYWRHHKVLFFLLEVRTIMSLDSYSV